MRYCAITKTVNINTISQPHLNSSIAGTYSFLFPEPLSLVEENVFDSGGDNTALTRYHLSVQRFFGNNGSVVVSGTRLGPMETTRIAFIFSIGLNFGHQPTREISVS